MWVYGYIFSGLIHSNISRVYCEALRPNTRFGLFLLFACLTSGLCRARCDSTSAAPLENILHRCPLTPLYQTSCVPTYEREFLLRRQSGVHNYTNCRYLYQLFSRSFFVSFFTAKAILHADREFFF